MIGSSGRTAQSRAGTRLAISLQPPQAPARIAAASEKAIDSRRRAFVDALLLGGDDAHQAQRLVADRLAARGAQLDLAIDLDAHPRE